jgi:hypothetical protein
MTRNCWDKTDDDFSRAFAASGFQAKRHNLPYALLQHCAIEPPDSASDMLQDSSVVGVDFSYSSSGNDSLELRLLGPYWDRWMVVRFNELIHYEAERANPLCIRGFCWMEFFEPVLGDAFVPDYLAPLPANALGCHIYSLSGHDRFTVLSNGIEFEVRVIPRQKASGDFRATDDGTWVLK